MLKRRTFLKSSFLSTFALTLGFKKSCTNSMITDNEGDSFTPMVISTWEANELANRVAFEIISKGGYVLDAIEMGVRVPESDPKDTSVGYGGLPDREGYVTLDACIMNELGDFGSVICLERIKHAVSVARKVLEESHHVYLAGKGALEFALGHGFEEEELMTANSTSAWQEWVAKGSYDPMMTPRSLMEGMKDNHDTIGMLAIDQKGRMGGACSSSGLAFKHRGRVGDSPIIGSGLFIDSEVGAATGSGLGEEIAKVCASHVIVETMRRGASPEEACMEGVKRIVKRDADYAKVIQAGFVAINKKGEYGSFSIVPGFNYCTHNATEQARLHNAPSWF